MQTFPILLAFLLVTISTLNFNLMGDQQFCLRFRGGNSYALQYLISGNQDFNVKCTIKQNQKIILQKQGVSEFQYITDYKEQIPVFVCFQSTDGMDKQVSFDFYEANDPVRKIIDKKDVALVQDALTESYKQMEEISRNQEFHIQRDEMHKQNLQESQNKIKWAGIVKIAFLMSSALIQLWIMKGFFTNKNPYQPVQMM